MDVEIDPDSQPSLIHSRLKVSRAKVHLDALHAAAKVYASGECYRLVRHDDVERGQCVAEFRILAPDATMALIVGDFVCCLRASLDHAAYQMAFLGGIGKPNTATSFPIVGVYDPDGKRKFNRSTERLPADAVRIIDSFQPHHYGNGYKATKLWQLEKLWNIDKHRRIPIHNTTLNVNILPPLGVPTLYTSTQHGGELRFPISAKSHVHLDPTIGVHLTFGDESEAIVVNIDDLVEIYEFVANDVLPSFKSVFQNRKTSRQG